MVTDNLKKLMMRHSRLTARLKVDKICQRIEEKDRLENAKVIKEGLSLPPQDKLKEAKEKVVTLIRQSYSQCQEDIPAFQGLRQLWKK